MTTRLGAGKGNLFVFRCGFDQGRSRVLPIHDSPKKTLEAGWASWGRDKNNPHG
ncbi:MAG: hypothetical protein ACE15F_08430 [bacterium]